MGRGGGTTFYKKFLLRKSLELNRAVSNRSVPIDLPAGQHFEESEITEIFINYSTSEGKVITASIEKKGHNQAFAYTLKFVIEKKKKQITKKRCISASEFIAFKANKIKDLAELFCSRICTMENDLYMIIDYYPQVQDQPIIVIL